jgi:hypothetical protein
MSKNHKARVRAQLLALHEADRTQTVLTFDMLWRDFNSRRMRRNLPRENHLKRKRARIEAAYGKAGFPIRWLNCHYTIDEIEFYSAMLEPRSLQIQRSWTAPQEPPDGPRNAPSPEGPAA